MRRKSGRGGSRCGRHSGWTYTTAGRSALDPSHHSHSGGSKEVYLGGGAGRRIGRGSSRVLGICWNLQLRGRGCMLKLLVVVVVVMAPMLLLVVAVVVVVAAPMLVVGVVMVVVAPMLLLSL